MKNSILLKVENTFFFALFLSFFAFGQSNSSTSSMFGPEYKMVTIDKAPRFSIQFETGKLFPSQKGIETYNGGGMDSLFSTIYSDPQLFEKLFETLGGEFFIGSFSEAPKFENFRQSNGTIYGFSGAYRLSQHFDGQLQFATYKTKVTAEFPIVVFDETTFETTAKNGSLATDLKSNTFQIIGNYYPISGVVQPFVGAGFSYTFTKHSVTKAQMGEVVFDLSENASAKSIGLIFTTGVETIILKNIVLQFNGKVFSVSDPDGSGAVWNKVLSGGVGVRF